MPLALVVTVGAGHVASLGLSACSLACLLDEDDLFSLKFFYGDPVTEKLTIMEQCNGRLLNSVDEALRFAPSLCIYKDIQGRVKAYRRMSPHYRTFIALKRRGAYVSDHSATQLARHSYIYNVWLLSVRLDPGL